MARVKREGLIDDEIIAEHLDFPPEVLRAMRMVAGGIEAERGYEWVQKLREEKPLEFTRELMRQERAYRDSQAEKLAAYRGRQAAGPAEAPDEDGERIVELAEQWLRERGGDASQQGR